MRVAALSSHRVDAYLTHLGVPSVRCDATGLAALQAAHLMRVPFHNLLLLANDGRPWALQSLAEVVDGAIAGIGGNCDRTTPPFTALLQAIGFDARLAAATVRAPGDHFVCVVDVAGERFLCDVGNGHPYLTPWRLDGSQQTQTFQGWRFEFDGSAAAGPTLCRRFDDGSAKTVYVVDPTPRTYDDFAPMVSAHYTRAGFGPFLSGLRAVCIQRDAVLTLRDAEYTRDTRFGRSCRRVVGREAFGNLLVERFGLPPGLVADAISVAARRRPDLFAPEPRWMALGRGQIDDHPRIDRPTRDAVPDVLVAFASVGRSASVTRLLTTLAEERRASGYPGRVGVLWVDNRPDAALLDDVEEPASAPGVTMHRVPVAAVQAALDRAAKAGVLPYVDVGSVVPIGAAREATLAALRAHLATPIVGLPHPVEHPMVVWMVDDDVAFEQLGDDGIARRRTHLLFRVARFWSTLPQCAAVLGTFTGDPPVPALDCLGGQVRDLAANLDRMRTLGSEASWAAPAMPPPTYDAYYDLTEAPPPSASWVWPYAPQRRDAVRAVAGSLLADLPRLLEGQQLTRPLIWQGNEAKPQPSLRRGGNTLYLDLDALFRWPTPVLATRDGVQTRRSDTQWAALAQRESPGAVVEVTLPLLHDRRGQRPTAAAVARCGENAAAQVRGVVLARALAEGRDVTVELAAREARVADQRQALRDALQALRIAVLALHVWQDAAIDHAIDEGLVTLDALDALVVLGAPLPGDALELRSFLDGLPQAIERWRAGW